MLVVRPITINDLEPLYELASTASHGLTTLPKDRELLRKRIAESERGFERLPDRPGGEVYLFVMEDLTQGRLVGTSGVVSKVGGFEPFYAYRVESEVLESKMLGVRKEVRTLHLVREHNGPCEIGSLYLMPEYRSGGNGRLLSLSRFLFMARHRASFAPQVIAELRGVLDDEGRSTFWDAIGRHFFDVDYPKADYLSMVDKQFIADLMPKHPIYVPLLPERAQEVIGMVHEHTRPARRILESEGFRFNGMVDIFEAGPILSCELDHVRAVRETAVALVGSVVDGTVDAAGCAIANGDRRYRVCQGPVKLGEDGRAVIDRVTALALGVKVGGEVSYTPLYRERGGDEGGAA